MFIFIIGALQVDSSRESAEAACDILSQLVNCSLKTLGLISTARPSFMELPKVSFNDIILLLLFQYMFWINKYNASFVIFIIVIPGLKQELRPSEFKIL